jgi:class 3 adenylate cyclase
MQEIVDWLNQLGMSEHAQRFAENKIDVSVLPYLTDQDLKDIGVPLGHRRKMLAAIGKLAGAAPAAPEPLAAGTEPKTQESAERRQVTVMFCDLVGSTTLASRFDPEDLRELIAAYHLCVAGTVARFDGFVAKYMGDGVLVYFGYPQAHEDDAERAIRAGLTVIEAVGRLELPERLSVRLGIASGLVVVGDLIGVGEAQERGIVGETPNLAARLQGLAEPGGLIIAENTRQQLGALFDLEDLGLRTIAGFADPQRIWRVLAESGPISRFEALRSRAAPLIGRDEEMDLLLRRSAQAKAGEGRVVLVSGEPGIGKSQLTTALAESIAGERHTRLRYFCSPFHQDSALHPFILQLERAAGFVRNDTAEQKRTKLDALLSPGAQRSDDMTLIAELLSLSNAAADLNVSAQRKREMLLEALLHQLDAVARSHPVLMVFEDAHWIDPTSRELMDLTIDRLRRMPVLLIITFRPEFQPAWGGQPHVTTLALNRLGARDVSALVHSLAGNAPLGTEFIDCSR